MHRKIISGKAQKKKRKKQQQRIKTKQNNPTEN